MISRLNSIINRFFKLLSFLNLVLILFVWTLVYPLLRFRCRSKNTKNDFTKYPSYTLFIWYQKSNVFWSKFIF